MHGSADPARIAENAQIAPDLARTAGRLFRIVRKLYGRPAIDRADLAHDRDRVEIDRAVWRAADEIISQVCAPAETDPNPSREVTIDFFDGINVHGVGKDEKLFLRIPSLLLPPFDDFFARLDRRRAVRAEAGPVGDPFGSVSQESL